MHAYAHGATVVHVFTHAFDYVALGILVACMVVAGAVVFLQRKS